MSSDQNKALREQLLHAMRGDQSHIDFESVVSDLSEELAGVKLAAAPHTAWQLLEHLQIAQRDILEFSRNPKHVSPKWPEEYWPETQAPSSNRPGISLLSNYRVNSTVNPSFVRKLRRAR